MKNQDFVLYKKELNAFRKSDTAYAKQVLAFAKKNPNNEHLVVSSCLLINDVEKFFGNNIPLKKPRITKTPKPILPHPLNAWAEYEQALAKALELDSKHLSTLQTFDGENIQIDVLAPQSITTDLVLVVETPAEANNDEATFLQVDESVEVYEADPVEILSNAAELVDDIDVNSVSPFEYENVEPVKEHVSISEHVNLSVSKEYVAPEELIVDNHIEPVTEDMANVSNVNDENHSMSSGGFNLKSKEYVAPEELTVDNSLEAAIALENDKLGSREINTVDGDISVDANLTIHEKDYVAPEELTVDNSIKVQNIIINPRKEQSKRRGLFEKKAKPVEYSGVNETDNERSEYTRDDKLDLFKVESLSDEKTADEKPVKTSTVDERTLAEANDYIVGSEAELKLKSKEYSVPDELIVDNSLPEEANIVNDETVDSIYVETVDTAMESNTEIRIKSKEYVAPEELTVDNSIELEDEPEEKKRSFFGRNKKAKDKDKAKAQPVVFLPPKPLDLDIPENQEEFVYTRKNAPVKDIIIDESIIASVANETKTPDEVEVVNDVVEEFVFEDDKLTSSYSQEENVSLDIEIDFNELAAELANEKLASEQVVYAKDKHSAKVKEEIVEYVEAPEDASDEYLELQKRSRVGKNNFDASSIIKDIKIIDI